MYAEAGSMRSKLLLTLVLVRNGGSVLLGLKKRGFGLYKWNGFGGKVKSGESVIDGAKRELLEESGLHSDKLDRIGHLVFEFVDDPVLLDVHVFTTSSFDGEPQESDEMVPKWFPVSDIPYSQMWADDKYWFPLFLKGAKFEGYFKFLGHDTILQHSLKETDDLEFHST